ncbi:DUF1800 domain-containing protein [Ktedonosporobacter rubrisoli]|nr:DUF1800 domain-containing protein [Ktedonosporobacter rubrisoli]
MSIYDQPAAPRKDDEQTDKRPAVKVAKSQESAATTPGEPAGKKSAWPRRKLLGALGLGAGVALAAGVGTEQLWQHGILGGLGQGPLVGNAQIGHLLRRAGFGALPEDLATYGPLGFNGAVDRLLNYQQVSDDAMENRLKALNLDLNKPIDQQRWWLLRMAWTQRPLLEKMTLFWHGVLTSSYRKVGGPKAYMRMIVQNQFFREHAFDTFDNILLGITSDPAMLVYLDLTKSRKHAPNENYARELMELFTLGLGHYTQQDVTAGAASLTGWHVVGSTTSSHYVAADHNTQMKQYLGHTGNLDYKDVVHILANHPAASWFICRKLFTFFAYENPSETDLQPLVDTYTKSNHNIGAVMRALLLSPQFSSPKAYHSRIKSPTEFVVGTYRALGRPGDGNELGRMTAGMGQTLFDPPNVAGWPGDKISSLWLNSGTWLARLNYIDLLLVGSRSANNASQALDLQGVVNANRIDSPEHFVDYFAAFLLDGNLSADRRTQLISYFTSQDKASSHEEITLSTGKGYPLNRVRGTLYLLMGLPEYQLN